MDLNKHFKCPEFTHVLKIGSGVVPGHRPAFTRVMFRFTLKSWGKTGRTKSVLHFNGTNFEVRIGMTNDQDLKRCLVKPKICRYT